MTIDDRLDFLRIDFETADVDYSIPPADKVVAAIPQLDHVAGIYKAFRVPDGDPGLIAQITVRIAGRTDPQRLVFHLHLDVGRLLEQRRGKARHAIVNLKRHARFGGSKSVDDLGLRVDAPEMIQDCLIGNLSRQTDIF